jgi:hypothetical protein
VGVTEGQLWTLLVGLVTAATLAVGSTLGSPLQVVSAPAAGGLPLAPAAVPPAPEEVVSPPPAPVLPDAPLAGVVPAAPPFVPPPFVDPAVPRGRTRSCAAAARGGRARAPPGSPTGDAPVPAKTAWFSADAATDGVALAPEVPEGALPVARRAGADYRVSALTLAGAATGVLLLREAEGTAAQQLSDTGRVDLCPLLEDFEQGPAQALAAAPTADCRTPVKGTRDASGVWSFDLAALPKPLTDKGFLLVPAVDAPPAFQVAYAAGDDATASAAPEPRARATSSRGMA